MASKHRLSNKQLYNTYLQSGLSLGVRTYDVQALNVIEMAFKHGYLAVLMYIAKCMKVNLYNGFGESVYSYVVSNVVHLTYGRFWMFKALHRAGLIEPALNGYSEDMNDLMYAVYAVLRGRSHILPYVEYIIRKCDVSDDLLYNAMYHIHMMSYKYEDSYEIQRMLRAIYTEIELRMWMCRNADIRQVSMLNVKRAIVWHIMYDNKAIYALCSSGDITKCMLAKALEYVRVNHFNESFTSKYDDSEMASDKMYRCNCLIDDLNDLNMGFHREVCAHLGTTFPSDLYTYLIMRWL